ncbi:MAG: T9SS type A sorting domain-containing protein [Calditrichaeota bacterium]|nr:T9SS type A sorting domain-containing protein [Calditrichota bacterium]
MFFNPKKNFESQLNLILLFVSLFALTLEMPDKIFAEMSDHEFFQCIDQNFPGLEKVKEALGASDTATAKIELLKYYQQPRDVRYFKLTGKGNKSEADDNLNHYFTFLGIRKYAGAADGTIDWTTKDEKDREWHFDLHRMYWIVNFGKVYASGHDEKYAREWIAELTDWVRDNSPGYPRTLDTGIRLREWVESYQYFVARYASPSISAEDHLLVLKSLIEQARFLKFNWRSEGNWGASETRGLGAVVVMFPEFKFYPDDSWESWRDLVLQRLQHHLSNDFYDDGVQFETSPTYHCIEYSSLFLTYKLMNLNNISADASLTELFVKPLEFIMHIHKPDGFLPQLSDTDRKSYLEMLQEGADIFQRQDMLYAATKGTQGTAPKKTFALFPNGGYAVLRSDWGENQTKYENTKYLAFDFGSNSPWHAHYDILNIVIFANNVSMIRDAGRYTYVSGAWRDYFKGTAAHNTVVIDHENQSSQAVGTLLDAATMPGMDFLAASHDGYDNLTHERRIIFIKPDYWLISDFVHGSGEHFYELFFHLDSPYLNYVTLDPVSKAAITPNFAVVPAETDLTAEIDAGWVSNVYNLKYPAPVIKYQKQGPTPISFETVISPIERNNHIVQVSKKQVTDNAGISVANSFALKVNFSEKTDWIFYSQDNSTALHADNFAFKANIAFVRRDADRAISRIQFYRGKQLVCGDTILVDCNPSLQSLNWFDNCVWAEGQEIDYFKIWAPAVSFVIVNGDTVNFSQQGNYITFSSTAIVRKNNARSSDPANFQLGQSYPNPFNQKLVIPLFLSTPETVQLDIYNLNGQKIKTLLNCGLASGAHKIIWDGSRSSGKLASSAIYLIRLKIGDKIFVKRAVLLK